MSFQRLNLLWVLTCLVCLGGVIPALADSLQINVPEVKVFSQPGSTSEVITTLFKGDVVPLSKKSPQGFKKVLIKEGSEKKIGYIRDVDLKVRAGVPGKGSRGTGVASRGIKPRVVPRSLHNRYAVGLSAGLNYQYQNSRSYTDTTGGNAAIGALSGSATEFGVFVDFPFSYNFKLRTYFDIKTVSVAGSATYQTSTIPPVPESTLLKESFLTLGALAQVYPSSRANWWWGGGLEFDHGNSGTLQFGTFPSTTLGGSDLPNFIVAYAAIGMDIRLGGSLFLVPDLRIGGVLNALPIILEGVGTLNLALGL